MFDLRSTVLHIGVLVGAALLAGVLTPLTVRYALARGVLEEPGGHRRHHVPIPNLGGVAIVVAFSLATLAGALLIPIAGADVEVVRLDLIVLLLAGVVLALVGLVDDRRGLSIVVRLVVTVGAAVALWATGTAVSVTQITAVDLLITIVWVVGITNAVNLLDNMDGLSAGIAAIASGYFWLLASLNGQHLVAALSAALAGVSLGFLRHNFHPARTYMGDSGALFLGFMLAALGIRLRFDPGQAQDVAALVPILVLGIAILDTGLVTTSRVARGRSPFVGGRDHISHRLVRVGVPVPAAVALMYAAAIGIGWLAVVVSRIDRVSAWMLAGFAAALGLFLAGLLWRVPPDDEA